MIIDLLKTAILENIGPLKDATKGWKKRSCMLCHTQGHGTDTRSRFGIQFSENSIVINCFNCGFSASYNDGKNLSKSFKFFLSQINVPQKFINQVEFEIFKQKNNLKITRDGDNSIENKSKFLLQKWKTINLPKDSLPIKQWLDFNIKDNNFLKVYEYVKKRKISDLDKFYWSPIRDHSINNRLIIPYYYRNNIVGYTARLCYDTTDKSIPKYYQQCPEDFVYNLDNQQPWSRKYTIVNEGVLDAWATDGVGILGEINQSKIDLINRLQKKIIVCPDRDEKGWDLVKAAMDNNWAVSFPKWDSNIKDAAEASKNYGRLLTLYSIISSAISGKEKIKLHWDIERSERNRKLKRNS